MMLCPIREDMTGHMPECNRHCAWLVKVGNSKCEICAVALIAIDQRGGRSFDVANYEKED